MIYNCAQVQRDLHRIKSGLSIEIPHLENVRLHFVKTVYLVLIHTKGVCTPCID